MAKAVKKTLATLIKMQKLQVDQQRRMLADLQNILDRIEAEIAALQQSRIQEQAVAARADAESMVTLAPFLAKVRARLEQLGQARLDAIAAVEEARDRLAAAFEEQKRYEIIRDRREAEAMAEEKRLDRLELDEIAETTHQRKKRGE